MTRANGLTSRIDALAAYWDGAMPEAAASPAPDEIATIAALRSRVSIAHPPATFVAALEAKLLATPQAAAGRPGSNPRLRRARQAAWGTAAKPDSRLGVAPRLFLPLAVMLLVVLSAGAIALDNRAAAPSATVDAPNQSAVWVSSAAGNDLVELDPNTLAARFDETAALAATPAAPSAWPYPRMQTYLSADGSTMVRLTLPDLDAGVDSEYDFECFDGVDGPLFATIRQSFASVTLLETPLLSPDGARLVVRSEGSNELVRDGGPPNWSVYDTRTGALVSTIYPTDGAGGSPVFDPFGTRLYRLVTHWDLMGQDSAIPPRQELVAYDLASGRETIRTLLPPIESAGIASAVAAATLTADGTALLLIYVDVDGGLRAIRTLDLSPLALGDPTPLRAAPSTPATPPATDETEVFWNAIGTMTTAISADGKSLSVLWSPGIAPDTGAVSEYRMASIDPVSGQIELEHALVDAPYLLVLPKLYQPVFRPSPDGASILIAGASPASDPDGRLRWVVQQRDATTFALLTEQTFVEYRSVLAA